MGLENSLWRAVAVYRVGALSYAIFLTVRNYSSYVNPALGWIVIASMAIWTGVAVWAWILIEDEAGFVTVRVRDEGVGMAATRLSEAEAAGRLGVAQSIKGRIRDMSGTVTITSTPGAGTEVEMRVPRQPTRR